MRILIVDDIRRFAPPADGVEHVYARNSREALSELKNGPWTEIWLDYDLGFGNENPDDNAAPFVAALQSSKLPVSFVKLITSNRDGRAAMLEALTGAYTVVVDPA